MPAERAKSKVGVATRVSELLLLFRLRRTIDELPDDTGAVVAKAVLRVADDAGVATRTIHAHGRDLLDQQAQDLTIGQLLAQQADLVHVGGAVRVLEGMGLLGDGWTWPWPSW